MGLSGQGRAGQGVRRLVANIALSGLQPRGGVSGVFSGPVSPRAEDAAKTDGRRHHGMGGRDQAVEVAVHGPSARANGAPRYGAKACDGGAHKAAAAQETRHQAPMARRPTGRRSMVISLMSSRDERGVRRGATRQIARISGNASAVAVLGQAGARRGAPNKAHTRRAMLYAINLFPDKEISLYCRQSIRSIILPWAGGVRRPTGAGSAISQQRSGCP